MNAVQLGITSTIYFCSAVFVLLIILSTLSTLKNHSELIRIYFMLLVEILIMCISGGFAFACYAAESRQWLLFCSFSAFYCIMHTYTLYLHAYIDSRQSTGKAVVWLSFAGCSLAWLFFLQSTQADGVWAGEPVYASRAYMIAQFLGFFVIGIQLWMVLKNRKLFDRVTCILLILLPMLPIVLSELLKPFSPIPVRSPSISIAAVIVHIHMYVKNDYRVRNQEQEILHDKAALSIGRIRPHFIYNALSSIYYIIDTDPAGAKRALYSFLRYMRTNLEMEDRDHLVPFREELEHVRYYLDLEMLRYGDRIRVTYDIQADTFSLPVLSVQPLVENAVKHGIAPVEKGGTLIISSRENEKDYTVQVINDGVPFPETRMTGRKGHVSLGIRTTSERIRLLSGGTLDIRQGPDGCGTVCEIRIPRHD